ncbi:hypothetical protein ACFW04_013206 [Cataglyphis niger]
MRTSLPDRPSARHRPDDHQSGQRARTAVPCPTVTGHKSEGAMHPIVLFPLKDKKILQSWLQHMSLGSNFVSKKIFLIMFGTFQKKSFQENKNKKCLRIGTATELKDFILNDRSLLCSYQFDEKYVYDDCGLKTNAVPTFCNYLVLILLLH